MNSTDIITRIANLAPLGVGLVFVWTGIVKAVNPGVFGRHLTLMSLLPAWAVPLSVSGVAGAEVGLGILLLLGGTSGPVVPLTVALLAGLSALSWWGVKSGRTTDCGCYGGFIQPSIYQSIGLNLLFAALITGGWVWGSSSELTVADLMATMFATLGALALSEAGQWYESKNGIPLFDLNPLKVGAKWKHKWARGATRDIRGETLVTFMGPDCPFCVRWVKVANAIIESPRLPRVIGVMATSDDKLAAFKDDKGIRFPLVNISPSLMNRMVNAVPTTVRIEDGLVQEIWMGDMPVDFTNRFRRAFFPDESVPAEEQPRSQVSQAV